MTKIRKVYVSLSSDNLHHGHINVIAKASSLGELTIGLLTEKAILVKKKLPLLNYNQRKKIISNIKGVKKVVPQNEWDDSVNIQKLKPDIVVHGDDWKYGIEKDLRTKVIKCLKKYGGKLIEIPHEKNAKSFNIFNKDLIENNLVYSFTPDMRRASLKKLLNLKNFLIFMEAHSPLSALIIEKTSIMKNKKEKYFDGFWSSSLTDSTLFGKPDTESLDMSLRLNNIDKIFDVTSKPLIMDIDTGGKFEHLKMKINSIEKLGISAVIMEDKTGLKKNSLFEDTSDQKQESTNKFAKKIKYIKENQITSDFMLIARIESFILNKGINDALLRSQKYVKAGVDGIMIHSKQKNPKEIINFAKNFRKFNKTTPLICVPSTYNQVKEDNLKKIGFNIVIYANQLLRSSYFAMSNLATDILKNSRAKESEKKMTSIKKIINLIPGA
tara:strand:+ start:625 stop:1944 length:1320 start_codon:yes stop_codon:yes gene_type:complete